MKTLTLLRIGQERVNSVGCEKAVTVGLNFQRQKERGVFKASVHIVIFFEFAGIGILVLKNQFPINFDFGVVALPVDNPACHAHCRHANPLVV